MNNDQPDVSTRVWSVDRFRYDDRGANLRERINKLDITGRARYLVWGPYDPLEAGRWTATVSFLVDEWAARHSYAVEFGNTKIFSRFEFRPGLPGEYELDIDLDAAKAVKAEIRLIMVQSSLGGMFQFNGATITRVT